jgi:hypothetical protein
VLLFTTLGALPLLVYPLGKDQGIYATVGVAILKGGVPYVDAWELKPPAIHYLYALGLWLFGRSPAAVHAIDLATVPITTAGLYWLGKRLGSLRVAFLVAVIFPVFYFTEHFASQVQSDSISTITMTLAVVCAFQAGDSSRASRRAQVWSFAAGMFCAWTLWFKHYYVFLALALVVSHVLTRRGFPVKEGLAFVAGGLLIGLSGTAYLLARGALDDLLATARGASQYTASGASVQGVLDALWHYFAFRWQQWGPVLVLAALWPVVKNLTPRLRLYSANEDTPDPGTPEAERPPATPKTSPPFIELLLQWVCSRAGRLTLGGAADPPFFAVRFPAGASSVAYGLASFRPPKASTRTDSCRRRCACWLRTGRQNH